LEHARAALRRTLRTVLVTAALAVAASIASAQTTVYVDRTNPAANDANIGTELQPYLTINGAMAANNGPNVTILVKPGVYRESMSVPNSGALGFPFVFRATGPGVVIDGSDDFSTSAQWAAAAGGEFLAAGVSWNPAMVFVDGVRLTVSTAAIGSLPANTFRYVSGQGLYVDLAGVNPGTRVTQVTRRIGFTMSTKQFVTIEGFEIVRSNDRGINVFGGSDLAFKGNRISFSNSYGIQLVGTLNSLIEGNLVTDAGLHGIGLISGTPGSPTGNTVRNNESARNAHPTIRQANGIFLSGAPNNTLSGNRLHHNQDTGMHFAAASNGCISTNNVSYANGDHGFDHLATANVVHMHDVAFGNFIDGFSFEGNSPGGQVYNSASVDNGITNAQNGHNLWVDDASFVGFASNHNLFWNSTLQPVVKQGLNAYATVAAWSAATLGTHDAASRQGDPLFTSAATGDFMPLAGSPLIDAAESDLPGWPTVDASGTVRIDATTIPDVGVGPVTFADIGAFEFIPPSDRAPVLSVPPARIIAIQGSTISFVVSASDPDGDPITSLTMSARLKKNAVQPTFVKNATNTSGTVTWAVGNQNGNTSITFIAANALADTALVEVQVKKATKGPGGGRLLAGEEFEVVALSGGYPMPMSSEVEFALALPSDEDVDFAIYDAQGRRVWSETRAEGAGLVRLRWTGVDMSGRRAATGLYFAKVRVGEASFVRKVVRN
jgi:parallel beta-helix repeat protein